MFGFIMNFFRRRKIRKHASSISTGFIKMAEISTANVVIDVEEPGFDAVKEDILAWGRQNGVKVNIFFFDFRKLGKDELLLTSIQTTIIKRELDWLGTPDLFKIAPLIEEESDLFISLVNNGNFPIDFVSKCAKARFKIGRHDYEGHAYNMIVSGSSGEDLRPEARDIFAKIKELLTKIE